MGSISTGHPAALLGLGAYRPRRVVTNDEVCEHLEVDADWVFARSGIATRRMAEPDETVVMMATRRGPRRARRGRPLPRRRR